MVSDNKRIAYNTIVIYVKLILSVVIGLLTSRLVLQALGASDYGLYSVVGGIVTLLNIIGVTMVSTSYRYISVEIGKGSEGNPNKIYNTILIIHIILAIFLIILGSVIGLWYIDNYLNVEPGKIGDAKFVLLFSMITTALVVLGVPSNGLIIAREKFVFTSIIEIIQSVAKLLLIALFISNYGGNRLKLYSILMAIATSIAPIFYTLYCYIKEKEVSKWKFNKTWSDYIGIIMFTSWLLLSSIAALGINQGSAIIMNIFFGTTVNAAFGIAVQLQNNMAIFPKGIYQAANPQIMKSIGENNQERATQLVYSVSKYGYFVCLLVVAPLVLLMPEVLKLWLGNFPDYTSEYSSLLIISSLLGCLGLGADSLIQAIGKIKAYQAGFTLINISLIPVIYVLYSLGFPPYSNAVCIILLTIITVGFQICMMSRNSVFSVKEHIKKVILPTITVSLMIIPLGYICRDIQNNTIDTALIGLFTVVLWTCLCIWSLGLNRKEKQYVGNYLLNHFKNRKLCQ